MIAGKFLFKSVFVRFGLQVTVIVVRLIVAHAAIAYSL